jgi:serine/threonine protein kinase
MEYCDGGQLFEAIRKAKYFTEGDVSRIMTQILSVVNYLEKKGIVHRDLKPENIVLEYKSNGNNIK